MLAISQCAQKYDLIVKQRTVVCPAQNGGSEHGWEGPAYACICLQLEWLHLERQHLCVQLQDPWKLPISDACLILYNDVILLLVPHKEPMHTTLDNSSTTKI